MTEAKRWRDGKTTAERGYGGKWQRERLRHLAKHPLCERCEKLGRALTAPVVNHRTPHKGNQRLFWDRSNWESLCEWHHNSEAQRDERGGKPIIGTDLSGWPVEAFTVRKDG